jgi:hypothetical protein
MKLFVFLCLFLLAVPAYAQDEAARVETLKAQLEGFLENQKSVALKNSSRLETKGSVTVEKASGYYAFTLPAITYTDAKGIRSEIGMIAMNAVPQANNEWKISLAVPTPIKSFGADGSEQYRTDIGAQNASGVWNERLGHFTAVDSDYTNVQFNNLADQSTVTIGALQINSQMNERDADAYTGKAVVLADNISIFDAQTKFRGIVPKVRLDTNLAGLAAKTPMTKEQVKSRQNAAYPDAYNMIAFMFGAPERVLATVTGLDAVNAQLQQSMITATPDNRAKLLQSILAVSAVSGMGKPVAGDTKSKSYDVVFGKDGNVTLNGTDFGALMNTTTQPAAGAPVLP